MLQFSLTCIGNGKGLPSVTATLRTFSETRLLCILTEATRETTGIAFADKLEKTALAMVTLMKMEEEEEPSSCRLENVAMPFASVTAVSPSNSPNEYSSAFIFNVLPKGSLKLSHTKARSCTPAGAGKPEASST